MQGAAAAAPVPALGRSLAGTQLRAASRACGRPRATALACTVASMLPACAHLVEWNASLDGDGRGAAVAPDPLPPPRRRPPPAPAATLCLRPPPPSARARQVDCFIFDCDGVIWRGDSVIDGVPETLDFLRSQARPGGRAGRRSRQRRSAADRV